MQQTRGVRGLRYPACPLRTAPRRRGLAPLWTHDHGLRCRVARVQRGISGRKHAEVPRAVQWQSAFHHRGCQRYTARRGREDSSRRPANGKTTQRCHSQESHRRPRPYRQHRDVNSPK